jgi:hypothetical protein
MESSLLQMTLNMLTATEIALVRHTTVHARIVPNRGGSHFAPSAPREFVPALQELVNLCEALCLHVRLEMFWGEDAHKRCQVWAVAISVVLHKEPPSAVHAAIVLHELETMNPPYHV